ncbi:hypothetical protein AVEN_195492-1 [Araneus ventricosus]|uniref:Uncharacterized protein n=1 Tax=Araneus ventricosus TaxID=182803 RepID=A0A4Y2K430_ARAVE|nr:hypothetical protein AVEN_195492-1 [Araneus ventricosus]
MWFIPSNLTSLQGRTDGFNFFFGGGAAGPDERPGLVEAADWFENERASVFEMGSADARAEGVNIRTKLVLKRIHHKFRYIAGLAVPWWVNDKILLYLIAEADTSQIPLLCRLDSDLVGE